jgi:hypothetical protein
MGGGLVACRYTSTTISRPGEEVMAKVIEYYISTYFHTPLKSASLLYGKVIDFYTPIKKSA